MPAWIANGKLHRVDRRNGDCGAGHVLHLYQGKSLPEGEWVPGHLLIAGPGGDLPSAALVKGDDDEDAVIQVVGETVIQKYGHYFGLSKEEIESRYWRG